VVKNFYLSKIKVNLFKKEAFFDKLEEIINDKGSARHIITLNPEMVVDAQRDNNFRNIINKAYLVIPDGIGIIKALAFLQPNKIFYPRIIGTDLVYEIIEKFREKIFLFGARDFIVKEAHDRLKKEFKNINIVGIANGYHFSSNDIVKRINDSQATILFVALGHSKQEKWIYGHLDDLSNVKIAIGVGGAFDFISGRVKRAPRCLRKIGLEWLWRFFRQPWRLKRIFKAVIIFPILVLKEKFNFSR
jgi:N-acetylglucosaminyldiphosphoundecaprenol N-acetyl-beta-D-mannosaminyltransferase